MTSNQDDDSTATPTTLELLSDPVRLRLVGVLFGRNAPLTLDELVEQFPDADPQTLRTELHHRHLPKLDDAGWVDYDPRDGAVTPGPRERVLRSLRVASREFDDRSGE